MQYGTFPDGFIWGVSDAAYSVSLFYSLIEAIFYGYAFVS